MENPVEDDLWEDHDWGGKNHVGLLIAAEYERTEEISGGQGLMEANYRRGLGKMPAVAPWRTRRKEDTAYQVYFVRI